MKRYLQDQIAKDLPKKMVMLSGPRQVGKTFMAKSLMKAFKQPQYFNYDSFDDSRVVDAETWGNGADLLIFDEIHKKTQWKGFLKGVVDARPAGQSILVTGSARLDTFRQSGESLAGRYLPFHLHPLSVRELADQIAPAEALSLLNRLGGFPEPFLSGSETEAARWRNQYYTDLVREDILEFSRIHEVRTMRILLEMLRRRVGSPLSHTSLAEDLKIAPNTVRSHIAILESLNIIFLIRPFHANLARAIQKEPKLYFYDSGYVEGDEGIRLENTVAVSLRKHVDYQHEVLGRNVSLHYVRTKEDKEVDFALVEQDRASVLIEVKLAETEPSPSLRYLSQKLGVSSALQVVQHLQRPQSFGSVHVVSAADWLATLSA